MESGTARVSCHVLRLTGFDHRRERRRLKYALSCPHQRCGDGEDSGSGVVEGVSEAPTFMEWSTMVVPTYPEGGSHALPVCQHHLTIRLCESATLSSCQRLKEHVARDCSGRFG